MQDYLLKEHKEKSGDHKQSSGALLSRRSMLQTYLDRAYEDKAKGYLGESEWREKSGRWKAELSDVVQKVGELDERKDEYVQRGVELIELAHDLDKTYESASPEKKRRIIEIVSSNWILRNGSIGFKYKKPFDLLVEGASFSKWWTLVTLYRTFFAENPYYSVNDFRQLLSA